MFNKLKTSCGHFNGMWWYLRVFWRLIAFDSDVFLSPTATLCAYTHTCFLQEQYSRWNFIVMLVIFSGSLQLLNLIYGKLRQENSCAWEFCRQFFCCEFPSRLAKKRWKMSNVEDWRMPEKQETLKRTDHLFERIINGCCHWLLTEWAGHWWNLRMLDAQCDEKVKVITRLENSTFFRLWKDLLREKKNGVQIEVRQCGTHTKKL